MYVNTCTSTHPLPLSLTHTHLYTYTHTRIHGSDVFYGIRFRSVFDMYTNTCTWISTHPLSLSHTHSLSYTYTHTRIHGSDVFYGIRFRSAFVLNTLLVLTSCLVGLWFGEKFSAILTKYYGTYMQMVLENGSKNIDWFDEIWTNKMDLGTVQQVILLQCVALCCSVLFCCSVLQGVAVNYLCSVLQFAAVI